MIQHTSMLSIFLTAFISFFISGFFGYSIHRMLHQPWSGRFNKSHMTHHLILYPPSDYQSDTYREPGKDNTVKIFFLFALPLIILPILLCLLKIISVAMMITAFLVMGVMSYLHDYLHDAFHIKNHFLTRIPGFSVIFAYWVHLHYLHHVDMNTNFGIFLFHWDRILKTFWSGP